MIYKDNNDNANLFIWRHFQQLNNDAVDSTKWSIIYRIFEMRNEKERFWFFFFLILQRGVYSHLGTCCHYCFIDINECNRGTSTCSSEQICVNTVGSYRCTCARGYVVSGQTCVGKSQLIFLLRTNWYWPYKARLEKPGGLNSIALLFWGKLGARPLALGATALTDGIVFFFINRQGWVLHKRGAMSSW